MIKPTLRPFRPSDAAAIHNRDGKQVASEQTIRQAASGPAMTAECDGRILGCAGVAVLWPGVAIAWMLLGDGINGHGVWLTHVTKRFLEDVIRALDLHRVEAVALVDSPRNQAWIEALGFTPEHGGMAQGYLTDGRSVRRYELVKGMTHG